MKQNSQKETKKKVRRSQLVTYHWPLDLQIVAIASWMKPCHSKAYTKPNMKQLAYINTWIESYASNY